MIISCQFLPGDSVDSGYRRHRYRFYLPALIWTEKYWSECQVNVGLIITWTLSPVPVWARDLWGECLLEGGECSRLFSPWWRPLHEALNLQKLKWTQRLAPHSRQGSSSPPLSRTEWWRTLTGRRGSGRRRVAGRRPAPPLTRSLSSVFWPETPWGLEEGEEVWGWADLAADLSSCSAGPGRGRAPSGRAGGGRAGTEGQLRSGRGTRAGTGRERPGPGPPSRPPAGRRGGTRRGGNPGECQVVVRAGSCWISDRPVLLFCSTWTNPTENISVFHHSALTLWSRCCIWPPGSSWTRCRTWEEEPPPSWLPPVSPRPRLSSPSSGPQLPPWWSEFFSPACSASL